MLDVNIIDLIKCTTSRAFLGLAKGAQVRVLHIHIWLALLYEFGTDVTTIEDLCHLRWSDVRLFMSGHTCRWGKVHLELHLPETFEILRSTIDYRTSTVKNAPFLFLVGGLLANVFETQHDSNDIFALLSANPQSLSTLREFKVKTDCEADKVFRQDIKGTESLLANAVQAVAGSPEEYRIIRGPSTQDSSLKPFHPWQAKTIIFNNLDLDVCLSSPPSDDCFTALLEYYNCSRGLLTYYVGEEPIEDWRCPFCNQETRDKIACINHTHSCGKAQAQSVDANFLPPPEYCSFLVQRTSVNSVNHRCNKRLMWATKKERQASILHFGAHRSERGYVCRWGNCATLEDGEIIGGVKFPSPYQLAYHFESAHGFSARERKALYCYFCDCWLAQSAQTELHIWAHKAEIEYSIRECGFGPVRCPYSSHRILKPWFCPFCYHIAELVPSVRFEQFGQRNILVRHVKGHINELANTETHRCPVYLARVCDNGSQMTPSGLASHLRKDHDLGQ